MKRICILTQNHISKNPRVLKESVLLSNAGYKVTILTTWHSSEALELDKKILSPYSIQYETYSDLRKGNSQGRYHRIRFQFFRRLNSLGIQSIDAGGYGPWSLLKQAIGEKADLYIIHQEIPTLIAPRLFARGLKVAYDFEDWYSRDLTAEAQRYRPVGLLSQAEAFGVKRGLWCTTTSKSLAEALAAEAQHAQRPEVIYNGFSVSERESISPDAEESNFNRVLRLAWISQTIGPGRGLEEFIQIITPFEMAIEIHLAGSARNDFIDSLTRATMLKQNLSIIVHPPMPPADIAPWLHSFDAGIASDIPNSPSRDYTVTNKILHYLLAGIPVLASPTKGHQEIAEECPESVCLTHDSEKLKQFLISLQPQSAQRAKIRKQAWQDGAAFSWEVQAKKLMNLIQEKLN